MTKFLLYQHQSSNNHGCEALIYCISEQIHNSFHNSSIVVTSFYKNDDDMFSFPYIESIIDNKQWLRRFTFPWLIYQIDKRLFNNKIVQESFMYCKPCFDEAQRSDICIAIGGDTYCYNKGKEHWPLERKIKKLGKKMMLWGCSIEPEDIPGEMEEHLSNFDVITVRDPISYEALINSKITSKIVRCADPAFLLPIEETELPTGWEEEKMIGLNFSPMVMGNIKDKSGPRKAIEEVVKHILKTSDNKVVLIPHVRLSFNDDIDELKPIYEKYKYTKRVLLIDDISLNARQLKYIISKCSMFVGARTHATIAAYSTYVPTLSIGYSVKARGIARDLFGNEEGMTVSIKNIDSKSLISAYENIYGNKQRYKEKLIDIMPGYCDMALVSGKELNTLIHR